jgi:tetratricopeptide (TPR) repeat protein
MTKMAFVGVALVALAAPLAAQQQDGVASRVVGGLDQKLIEPDCKLDGTGHFLVRSGKTYLNTAITTAEAGNKARAVSSGIRVITEAITTNGQEKNPGAWYYLGRLHLQHGDVVGADTAFTRAEQLAPACKADIQKLRYRTWATLASAGGTFRQQKQDDSAMVMYRAAHRMSRNEPLSLLNMAGIFSTQNQTDSALHYYELAAATQPTDPTQVKARNQALYNMGVVQLNGGNAAAAVASFRRYVAAEPNDVDGTKALAQAFRGAGMADSAAALERQLVSATPGIGATGEVSVDDLFDIAVKQFNDKNYKDAAETFGRVLEQEPTNRDALYNQANAYLALQDGAKLAEAAKKLVDIEPLSEHNRSLLAQGHKFAGNQEGLLEALIAREAQTVDLKVEDLSRTADGATLTATATGRDARNESNQPIPPKPITVTFEFLGEGGAVVGTTDVAINPLKPGETQAISAKVQGQGIRSWRYKVK